MSQNENESNYEFSDTCELVVNGLHVIDMDRNNFGV